MIYPPLWDAETEARIRKEARNLDQQTTPDHVQMCTRCVMTNQRPRITFDEEGVCSACRYAERKHDGIDWRERSLELEALLADHMPAGGYDVIVPGSGGKDSSFVASTLRDTHGMVPLVARFAPFMTTEVGERNWQSFIHHGFDTVTFQPNGLLHRKLARLALEFYGDPFQPFVYGQLAFPMREAERREIKLVFFGENGEAIYGGDTSANDKPCWDAEQWDRVYTKGASINKLSKIAMDLGAITEDERERAAEDYGLPWGRRIQADFHWLSYYMPWYPQQNYYHACEHTGFEANPERSEGTYSKYASIDDKLDGLHYYFGYLKFGIGRCTSDAAHEVRDGELTRDEALALVQKYDGEFPTRHLDECLDYLGMDREALDAAMERFRGPHVSHHR